MINRSLQSFVEQIYGGPVWRAVVEESGLDQTDLDRFNCAVSEETEAVLSAASTVLSKPRAAFLEDFGTFLVSHDSMYPLRRILRFSGAIFLDFLHSLDELPERARLAVPHLDVPDIRVTAHSLRQFTIAVDHHSEGVGHVMAGMLSALADDYGALVLIDHNGRRGTTETLSIDLAVADFTEGRRFDLRLNAS